jgi:hypothetical protein
MIQVKDRVEFNPKDKAHVELYRKFLENDSWHGGCIFKLEQPYLSIPDMIKDKMIYSLLKVEKKYD